MAYQKTLISIFIFMLGSLFSFSGCGKSAKNENIVKKTDDTPKPADMITKAYGKLLPPPDDKIYFGAYADFGPAEDNVSEINIKRFEKTAGKKIAWAYFSNQWDEGIVYPKEKVHEVYNAGKIPFIRMIPQMGTGEDVHDQDPVYKMQSFIDGDFDEDLRQWARDAKADKIPLLIDFGVEMTGFWMPWSGLYCGAGKTDGYGDPTYPDGPERFRDAYRHIINIFREEEVHNVTWFFHPDIQRLPDEEWNSAKYYYPGDDYIDWIGLSVYGVQFKNEDWILFSESVAQSANNISQITSANKPVAILEFGVTDGRSDGTKSDWFIDAFDTILNTPKLNIKAISYWNENWENKDGSYTLLKIDSSPHSLTTFKSLIQNDRFISKCNFEELAQ